AKTTSCGIFGHVLFPQESTALLSNHCICFNHINDKKIHTSEGNSRRLLRESEDDKTPQGAFFVSEEAYREPAESVVKFPKRRFELSFYISITESKFNKSLRRIIHLLCSKTLDKNNRFENKN
ncbi:hypothetical protein SAMN05216389_107170, partial [Oceanobacillus limi]